LRLPGFFQEAQSWGLGAVLLVEMQTAAESDTFLHFTVRCYAQLGIPMEYRRPLWRWYIVIGWNSSKIILWLVSLGSSIALCRPTSWNDGFTPKGTPRNIGRSREYGSREEYWKSGYRRTKCAIYLKCGKIVPRLVVTI